MLRLNYALDLYVHSRRQSQRLQRVDNSLIRADNIDESFMNSHFKLLARIFMHESGTVHRIFVNLHRQWNGAQYLRPVAQSYLDYLSGALVDKFVIVSSELYSQLRLRIFFRWTFLCCCWHCLRKNSFAGAFWAPASFPLLFSNLRNDSRSHGLSSFADGELLLLLHSHRNYQFNL